VVGVALTLGSSDRILGSIDSIWESDAFADDISSCGIPEMSMGI